ncbi:uncharacterized protein LOC131202197 isoform X2 [Ahaetulla prasina]|uniref:uncharacterized protein LOC131202197 isoform X2 n=1 Tax=Ahaetulla prasina TaxID=499056 RepID=UPI0026487C0B|nr:uncharacterized protein LOC131202197 isoform X2 [Ahaetulla prasina]XP_058046929.1 uncharacterized protein LOC131202197 isoform X2 [Ahaetulla prasina]
MATKAAETLQKPNTPNTGTKATPVHSEVVEAESGSEEEEEVFHTGRAKRVDRDECVSCGGQHQRQNCRFKDAICRRCEKKGHIAQACRAPQPSPQPSRPKFKPANQQSAGPTKRPGIGPSKRGAKLNQTTVRVGHASTRLEKKIFTWTHIEAVPCKMEVDTGSSITIISWDTVARNLPEVAKRQLQTQKLRVEVTGVHSSGVNLKDELLKEFEDVFQDCLGKYVGTPISFNLDPQMAPIRLKARWVPFALKPKIDRELDKLVNQGILVPVDHAKWETPIVTSVKPDGSVWICADYKATLNKVLQKSAYPVPVVQHLLHSLGQGQVFAKLDLAQAYQQLPVDNDTAEAQTIVTHRGAFKCT